MDYSEEQLKERFDRLPDDIKAAIANIETEDIIFELGDKYKLHIDQVGELANEAGLVMLGLHPSATFADALQGKLKIPRETAESLTKEINQQIFLPIRDSLQQLAEQKQSTTQTPVVNPTATPNIFEEKMGKMFKLPKEQVDLPEVKPWVSDPYMEKPE